MSRSDAAVGTGLTIAGQAPGAVVVVQAPLEEEQFLFVPASAERTLGEARK